MRIEGFINLDVDLESKEKGSNVIYFVARERDENIFMRPVSNPEDINKYLKELIEIKKNVIPDSRFNRILNHLEERYEELRLKTREQQLRLKKNSELLINQLGKNFSDLHIRKIVLIGLRGAGKTSIYRVLFHNCNPIDTAHIPPTKGIERHELRFGQALQGYNSSEIGTYSKNLNESSKRDGKITSHIMVWDLGGQEKFLDEYLKRPERYFDGVNLVIFVIDVSDVNNYNKARTYLHNLRQILIEKRLLAKSPSVKSPFYIFLHKIDLLVNKDEKWKELTNFFKVNPNTGKPVSDLNFLRTSIYDATIHTAWSRVMNVLIPKSSNLNFLIQQLKQDLGVYSALMLEKRTGLPLCASKSLMDEYILVGTVDRLLISVENVLPDLHLTKLQKFMVETRTGSLHMILFSNYYMLVLLAPKEFNINDPKNQKFIDNFIEKAIEFI